MPLKLYPKHKKLNGRRPPVTWVVVADAKEARTYVRTRNHAPILIPVGNVLKATPVERETGRHALGRVFESKGSARHMAEPSIDIKQETRRRFAQEIAEKLEECWEQQSFDRLILIAPSKMIGDLRKGLANGVKHVIVAEIHKDLTRAPLQALAFYLGNHGLI